MVKAKDFGDILYAQAASHKLLASRLLMTNSK